jgi:transketolase
MERYSNKGNKPTKTGFGEGVLLAGERNTNIVVLGADITASVGLDMFKEKFPDRFFSFGIAEQNCIGVASGMALSGKIPVFSTYGVFAALRTTDQIRVSVCYNNLHVIVGGAHAGVSVGPDGATHQALEDIAIMRVLPNMTVLSPCDATQAKLAVIAAVESINSPVYIRFGRDAVPDFTSETQHFEIGRAQVLKEGNDLSILSTGHLTWEALEAAFLLEQNGINARVINFHTIKPIDKNIIIEAALQTKAIITAEEHQIYGGFGSAVSEVLSANCPVPVEFIGMNDCFGESGKPEELMRRYKMKSENIVDAAMKLIERKKKQC